MNKNNDRWFECSGGNPCFIRGNYYLDSIIGIYLEEKTLLLDKNNKPYKFFFYDCDMKCDFVCVGVIESEMISKGLKKGISMDTIRNTYFQVIKVLEDEDIFDLEKALNMNDYELEEYVKKNPELNFEKRYRIVFNEAEQEQIYLGLINGLSEEVINDTYCKFEVFDKTYEDIGFSFKYKEAISLYDSYTMSFARTCLEEGIDIEKVKYILRVEKDKDGNTYNLFDFNQKKALKKCFNDGLSIENMNNFLAFREEYVSECYRKVCICSYEEILEAKNFF